MSRAAFGTLLESVQDAGEDFEWYPTTEKMIQAVARWIPEDAKSIMDIGAGDGRVLLQLAEKCKSAQLYAIEKSNVLIQAQPENVIPVGTDLFEQNLACLPFDYLISNPPYSQYEAWSNLIIETGHAKKAFLVIPRRWKENEGIALALKKRGATTRVIHSDDFLDAVRQARAVIDIVEVTYPRGGRWDEKPQDPFDIWFDENVSTFDAEKANDTATEYERQQQDLARIRHLDTITDMVDGYNEEYERMQENYRAIFRLDYALLKELGVKKDAIREGIKAKMAGLKAKYWTLLFERLDTITERLSTKTKEKFLQKLTGRATLAFTANNAYAVVLWAIKNANKYFVEQTLQLYRDLSTFEGVMNYKSNQRAWERSDWRYRHDDEEDRRPSRYALDYRIVVYRYTAICSADRWDSPGGLSKSSHEIIDDVLAVLYNLGFRAVGQRPRDRMWVGGTWEDWHVLNDGNNTRPRVLFQVKAFKNGNVHLRFLPDAIKALNVEAGRLLGWLRGPADVETELGYSPAEAQRFYGCTKLIAPSSVRLLEGAA